MKDKEHDIEKLQIKQEDLYATPDGFFDELEQDILKQTVGSESKKGDKDSKVVPIQGSNNSKWWWAVAAAFLIGMVSITIYQSNKALQHNGTNGTPIASTIPADTLLSEISADDMVAYFEDQYEDGDAIVDYAVNYGITADNPIDLESQELETEVLIEELGNMDISIDDIY